MYLENFEKLPTEKQMAILNAAFICFGKNGYKKTAISEIAAKAGVSKAALFHYFGTKKDLYQYLFRFSSDKILEKLETGTEDFFECIKIAARMKLAVIETNPGMFDFLSSLVQEDDSLITELREINVNEIRSAASRLFINVDWNRLLPDITIEEARNLVTWVNEGYVKANAGKKSASEMIDGLNRYLELIKKSIYKEAYL